MSGHQVSVIIIPIQHHQLMPIDRARQPHVNVNQVPLMDGLQDSVANAGSSAVEGGDGLTRPGRDSELFTRKHKPWVRRLLGQYCDIEAFGRRVAKQPGAPVESNSESNNSPEKLLQVQIFLEASSGPGQRNRC